MNYKKIYQNIIDKHGHKIKPLSGYFEKHHIIPVCVGGTNAPDNLIYISARCHLILHRILCRIYPKNIKLAHAFFMMCTMKNGKMDRIIPNSRVFEDARKRKSELLSEILTGSNIQFNSAESKAKRSLTSKKNKSYQGLNNGKSLPVDVYNYFTGELVASNVSVTEWGRENNVQRNLNATLYADREKKSNSRNRHHAKGYYIVMHGQNPYPPKGGSYMGVYSNQGHIGLKKNRRKN